MRWSSLYMVAFLVLLGVGTANADPITLTGSPADWGVTDPMNGFDTNGSNGESWYTTVTGVFVSSFSGESGPYPPEHIAYAPLSGSHGIYVPALVPVYDPAPVPEPRTIVLLGSGLLGLVGYGRKRFKK